MIRFPTATLFIGVAALLSACGGSAAPSQPSLSAASNAAPASSPGSTAAKPSTGGSAAKPSASAGLAASPLKLGDEELKTFSGHTNYVTSLLFTSASTLASGSLDQETKLWDVSSGQATKTLDQPGQAVNGLAASKDGKLLATAGGNIIALWDLATGKQTIKRITAQTNPTQVFAAFSPDGKTLLVGTRDGLKAYDPATGEPSKTTFADPASQVTALSYSPDGSLIAAAAGPAISLLDAASGQGKQKLSAGTKDLASVAFSPDGKQLASAGHDGLKLWDVGSGKEIKTLVGGGSSASTSDLLALSQIDMSGVAFSPDGKLLIAGGSSGLRAWDAATDQPVKTPDSWAGFNMGSLNQTAHAGAVNAVAFSADGKLLASGGNDKTVKLWQIGG